MCNGYIHSYGSRPGPYTCHVTEKFTPSRDMRRILFRNHTDYKTGCPSLSVKILWLRRPVYNRRLIPKRVTQPNSKINPANVTWWHEFFINMAGIRPGAYNYGLWISPSHISADGVNRLLRPFPSDRCMDYHLLTWKIKMTTLQEEQGHPSKKKCLFQMTGIRPCVGTLWHGLTSEYTCKCKRHRFHCYQQLCLHKNPSNSMVYWHIIVFIFSPKEIA